MYQKSLLDRYNCMKRCFFCCFFRSKTLEKFDQKVLFTCTYNGAEKHVTCERFENAASRTKTNKSSLLCALLMMTSVFMTAPENAASRAKTNVIATVHFTGDDVSFYDGPGMLIRNIAKPCINSTWIALLIHGFVPVKTWLLIAIDTAFYAIIRVSHTIYPFPDSMTTLGQRRILVSRFVGPTLVNYVGPKSTCSLSHRRANALGVTLGQRRTCWSDYVESTLCKVYYLCWPNVNLPIKCQLRCRLFVRMKYTVNKLWSAKISSSTFAMNVNSDVNRKQINIFYAYKIRHSWVYWLYLHRYAIFTADVAKHIWDDQSPTISCCCICRCLVDIEWNRDVRPPSWKKISTKIGKQAKNNSITYHILSLQTGKSYEYQCCIILCYKYILTIKLCKSLNHYVGPCLQEKLIYVVSLSHLYKVGPT